MEFKQGKKLNIYCIVLVVTLIISLSLFMIFPTSFEVNAYSDYFMENAWHLNENGLNVNKLYKEIKDSTGIDVNVTKSDVVVAVIDSGVDTTNPFFGNSIWVNEDEWLGEDGVDDDKNGIIDDKNGAAFYHDGTINANFTDCMVKKENVDSKDWHGTHVAGIVHSVAPNIKIMPIRAGSPGSSGASFSANDVKKAIIYAVENGADIINMSFGGVNLRAFNKDVTNFTFNGKEYAESMQSLINYANSKGVLVVAAAGNDGLHDYFYPAFCDNVISVMSSTFEGSLAKKSNYGFYDVAAPGIDILSSIGNGIHGYKVDEGILGLSFKDGTSMAAPYVSGVAALLLSVLENNSLIRNASDLAPYLTNKYLLSQLDTNGKLANENVLLDYQAVSNIFQSLVEGNGAIIEDGVVTKDISVFDNEKLTLEPSRLYDGKIEWYVDGELFSESSKCIILPKEDILVELKVDGVLVEKYNIVVKSYNNYLLTIIGGVIGGIAGLSLIIVTIVVILRKKKARNQ